MGLQSIRLTQSFSIDFLKIKCLSSGVGCIINGLGSLCGDGRCGPGVGGRVPRTASLHHHAHPWPISDTLAPNHEQFCMAEHASDHQTLDLLSSCLPLPHVIF